MKSYDVTTQLKATHCEQYFSEFLVLLLFMLDKVALTFRSVMCDHFNKSFLKLKNTNFPWVLLLLDSVAEWSAPGIRNRKDVGSSSVLSAVSGSPSCSLLPVYPVCLCIFCLSSFSKLPVD